MSAFQGIYAPLRCPGSTGVSMVAMNYQVGDEPMLLNRAKFKANGGCGYGTLLPIAVVI